MIGPLAYKYQNFLYRISISPRLDHDIWIYKYPIARLHFPNILNHFHYYFAPRTITSSHSILAQ